MDPPGDVVPNLGRSGLERVRECFAKSDFQARAAAQVLPSPPKVYSGMLKMLSRPLTMAR